MIARSPEQASSVHAIIDEEAAKDSQAIECGTKSLEAKLSPHRGKLNRLTRAYLDQLIDEETDRRKKDDLTLQRNELKQ